MEERDRFISSTKNMSDVEVENKLRPISFDEYVDQVTGRNSDNRPVYECMAEIEEIKKKFT